MSETPKPPFGYNNFLDYKMDITSVPSWDSEAKKELAFLRSQVEAGRKSLAHARHREYCTAIDSTGRKIGPCDCGLSEATKGCAEIVTTWKGVQELCAELAALREKAALDEQKIRELQAKTAQEGIGNMGTFVIMHCRCCGQQYRVQKDYFFARDRAAGKGGAT